MGRRIEHRSAGGKMPHDFGMKKTLGRFARRAVLMEKKGGAASWPNLKPFIKKSD